MGSRALTSVLLLFPGGGDEVSPTPLHPSESRHSPIVTRLPPRGQDHKVLGLGVTTQGGADDVVDGVVLIHLLHQLHTPVGRMKSGLCGEQLCQAPVDCSLLSSPGTQLSRARDAWGSSRIGAYMNVCKRLSVHTHKHIQSAPQQIHRHMHICIYRGTHHRYTHTHTHRETNASMQTDSINCKLDRIIWEMSLWVSLYLGY